MVCPYCRTANADGSYYCSSCRQPLYYQHPQHQQQSQGQPQTPYAPYTPPQNSNDRGVLALTILISWGVLESLMWLAVQYLLIPGLRKNDSWEMISTLYDIISWATMAVTVTLVIVLSIVTRNRMARTIMIIFGCVNIITTVLYRLVEP